MKITLQTTKASLKRRVELQSKIYGLLQEYDDVPILVMSRLLMTAVEAENLVIEFEKNKKSVNIIVNNVLEGLVLNQSNDLVRIPMSSWPPTIEYKHAFWKIGKRH